MTVHLFHYAGMTVSTGVTVCWYDCLLVSLCVGVTLYTFATVCCFDCIFLFQFVGMAVSICFSL